MIYIVQRPGQYVAAILSSTLQLQEYLNKLTPASLGLLAIESHVTLTYPFCILESDPGKGNRAFKIVGLEAKFDGTITKLQTQKYGAKPLSMYTIEKDFWGDPMHPWKDYMGVLPHEHMEE
jgi:hypothetical protein